MPRAVERVVQSVSRMGQQLPLRSIGLQSAVPLAWRNIFMEKRRMLRSISAIGFAVLLMMIQLGFRGAFLDSSLEIIRKIDADIIITSASKIRFGRKDPFSRRQLYAARGIDGVASARPIYGEWMVSAWKNPRSGKPYNVQLLAFDPDQPVFLFPEVNANLQALKQPDTALYDRRARRTLGQAETGTVTELARRQIHVLDTFALGPDFTTDGTVITSDRTYLKFFAPRPLADGELADIELGIIKVLPAHRVDDVKRALRQALPDSIAVRTKAEQVEFEIAFQNSVSSVGPVFALGAAIGFIVGMMISYQILYTDLSDQLPQYATLKAIGYQNSYLVRVVLEQASIYAFASFIPAWVLGICLFFVIGELALLPMHMTIGIVTQVFALTLGMCVLSGVLAIRRVLAADPAEVF